MPPESIVTANRYQGPVYSMNHQTNDQNEFTKLNKRMFLKKIRTGNKKSYTYLCPV